MSSPGQQSEQSLVVLQRRITRCARCPELRDYCAEIAQSKRRSYADWKYWGKPVPSLGDCHAKIMIVGLAPAAHGANRTGRMFTGDRSGDFLYAALHRAGLANQATSIRSDDGLTLHGVYITAAAHCAPPANKPTPRQLMNCSSFLAEEIEVLRPPVVMCLGGISWNAVLAVLARKIGRDIPKPRPKFSHAAEVRLGAMTMLGCYHVSQQNTFTGRLTIRMIDSILARAMALARESTRSD